MITVAMAWRQNSVRGSITVRHGRLAGLEITGGTGKVKGSEFSFSAGPARLILTITDEQLGHDAFPTMVRVGTEEPFAFLLRDVDRRHPIWIPAFGVTVSAADDDRHPTEIAAAIAARGGRQALQAMAAEPEESFAAAAAATRAISSVTWLGLSRDMRIFEVGHGYDTRSIAIWPRRQRWRIPQQTGDKPVQVSYTFMFGRGFGCVHGRSRRLEDGGLPILHGRLKDDDVTYKTTAFASLEWSPLTAENLRGTDYLLADGHSSGHMFTPEQAQRFAQLDGTDNTDQEQPVLYYRIQAVNHGTAPRYAWMSMPAANFKSDVNLQNGCCRFAPDQVYAVGRLNGQPMPKREVAVLIPPGESATLEIMIPHAPISGQRAQRLAEQSFGSRHAECRAFWQAKLDSAAQVHLPERRIDEMVRAGLLHLDLVSYGLEPDGTVAPTIGVYCPIGSESSPIVQFIDSMGWHDLARRSLEYFLDKQHDSGFIQNFGGYMLETGPALWSMGEHFRYTRDEAWVRRIAPKLILAVDYLIAWRDRNRTEARRAQGAYGLMDGKVADPEDPFGCFMLNGYAYLGMKRVAEMLAGIDKEQSRRIGREAESFKEDLRTAIIQNQAKSPVVPLGDGTWSPTMGPWGEADGPVCLLTDDQTWGTHGTYVARDSMIGPIYLILSEVIDPCEPLAESLLNYHADLFHQRNLGFSQPYYTPHPWVHLARGEVKAFLKEYYNGIASLADRETYTFWEHLFNVSPHKTHEEGWFLMRTRWMLYREAGQTLHLLSGIPRAWMAAGQKIELSRVASYFGPLSLRVVCETDGGVIRASIVCEGERRPESVTLRIPHPDGIKAVCLEGGTYDPATETVGITGFNGTAEVTLGFETGR